ncbi:DUF2312 domain-containing protein [Aurantimonas aggregata]|uniref:DUF2312 domain-containing protein n=1 Tax=Aurantimonas aggregata TaxID=2047720 RepID=A0A6L9MGV1_9HYPH|nr:DUF2312 domain-containing protein [Aurantimonas aggregata]NDV87054.1 DUF2312 domain-containing protein [Aurantimonas aggregata]
MSEGFVAADRIRSFVERIERLDEEKATIGEDLRDVYAEAKGEGFDKKALRRLVSIRKQGLDQYREDEAILELYLQAIGMAADLPEDEAPAADRVLRVV